MEAIRVGSAVRISWPGDSVLGRIYHGKFGTVLDVRGWMRQEGQEAERLYLINVEGRSRHAVLGEGHLIVTDDPPTVDVATCQSCGHYDDSRRASCSSCGGELG